MSLPSNHLIFVCKSFGSRFKPRLKDGITENQDAACGVNTDRRLAELANEELSKSALNRWSSILLLADGRCQNGVYI